MSIYTLIQSNNVEGVFDLELFRVIGVNPAGSQGSGARGLSVDYDYKVITIRSQYSYIMATK